MRTFGKGTEVIVFLTEQAENRNYNNKRNIGLYDALSRRGFKIKKENIKTGMNQNELWYNFNAIFNKMDENDEVYIDVTYSLRSIPLIFMSLLNYVRVVKNVKIKSIFYGAYDVGESIDDSKRIYKKVPIFNLTFFNTIQQWSSSIEAFMNTGNALKLYGLIEEFKNSELSKEKKKILQ